MEVGHPQITAPTFRYNRRRERGGSGDPGTTTASSSGESPAAGPAIRGPREAPGPELRPRSPPDGAVRQPGSGPGHPNPRGSRGARRAGTEPASCRRRHREERRGGEAGRKDATYSEGSRLFLSMADDIGRDGSFVACLWCDLPPLPPQRPSALDALSPAALPLRPPMTFTGFPPATPKRDTNAGWGGCRAPAAGLPAGSNLPSSPRSSRAPGGGAAPPAAALRAGGRRLPRLPRPPLPARRHRCPPGRCPPLSGACPAAALSSPRGAGRVLRPGSSASLLVLRGAAPALRFHFLFPDHDSNTIEGNHA